QRNWPMRLWWLSFRVGVAVIVRAETLVHARLLLAMKEPGLARHFADGFVVDAKFERTIPDGFVGRKLSRAEAGDLLQLLRDGRRGLAMPSRYSAGLVKSTM